jgi:hypothetical protein
MLLFFFEREREQERDRERERERERERQRERISPCAQAGLELSIFLSQTPGSWDCRSVPPCLSLSNSPKTILNK